jgi:predicted secreted protein
LNIKYDDFKSNAIILSHELINVIHLNDIVLIELTESPSTGYCWFHTVSDTSIISLDEKKIYDFNKPNIIGGMLQIIWKFKCLNPGECKIHFSYYKSWKKESSPLDEHIYVIKVEQ